MRCATLAGALRERGAEVLFVSRDEVLGLLGGVQAGRPEVMRLLPAGRVWTKPDGAAVNPWLGVPSDQDADETCAALASWDPDVVVVDHYGLDATWECRVAELGATVMAIDDLADRRHACAVLLDQNHIPPGAARYAALAPPAATILAGPRYALVSEEYSRRRREREQQGAVARALVFFGGADQVGMTRRTLEALATPDFAGIALDVVVGPHNPDVGAIEELAAVRPNTTIHGPRPHLADLMERADIAIGAGGTTTWERMCLGLPAIVISIADNQIPGCRALHEEGLITYIGPAEEVDAASLQLAVAAVLRDADELAHQSVRARLLVDGLGRQRVAEVLMPTQSDLLQLRGAGPHDIELFYGWANDPVVRRQAHDPTPIRWDEHESWFAARIADQDCDLYVLEAQGLPVGQVRFDFCDGQAILSYSLDPIVRGRGWARVLILGGVARLQDRDVDLIRADVRIGNKASCAVLARLGFQQVPTPRSESEQFATFSARPHEVLIHRDRHAG